MVVVRQVYNLKGVNEMSLQSPTKWTKHSKSQFGKPRLFQARLSVMINNKSHDLGRQVINEQWVETLKSRNVSFKSRDLAWNVWFAGSDNMPVYVVLRSGDKYYSICPTKEDPKCFTCKKGLDYIKSNKGKFQVSGQFCHGTGYGWLMPNERVDFTIKVGNIIKPRKAKF